MNMSARRLAPLLATLLLASCAPEPESTPARDVSGLHIPRIDWPKGEPSTDDPWARALLETLIIEAAALNAHDFSSPALTTHMTETYVTNMAVLAKGSTTSPGKSSPRGYARQPGPKPVRIADVNEDGPQRATITACSVRGWRTDTADYIDQDQFDRLDQGVVVEFVLVTAPNGSRQLEASHFSSRSCPLGSARAGFFAPTPDFGAELPTEELIMPDGTAASWD